MHVGLSADKLVDIRRLRARLLASPSVATWSSFLARSLPLIVLPPFVFRSFSSPEAALWFILITLQGLQLLLESSVGLTFVRAIGFAMGGATQLRDQRTPDLNEEARQPNLILMSRVWAVMRGLYWLLGIATFVLIGVMGLWSAPVLIDQIKDPNQGWGALVIFVIGAALRAYGGLYISYLYGVGKIALLRWWEMSFWVLATLMALGVIMAGGGLMDVVLAYQVPLLANLVCNAVLTRHDQRSRDGFIRIKGIDWEVFGQVWPGMWRASLGVAIYLGVVQGAGLYYTRVGSTSEVATYLFAMSLMRPMMQFAQVPFTTKFPRLAELQASGDRNTQVAIARRGMFLSNALLSFMVLVAAAVLPVFAWIGGDEVTNVPLLLWVLIGLAACLERIGAMHLQLYSQTNHIVWHWANGGTALLFVFFVWILLSHMGMFAFPVSLCLAILIFYLPFSMRYSYKHFELPIPSFELGTSVVPLLIILLLLLGVSI
jgi:hypothetical protein